MSARVKKHCSVLNYLKHADPDLHELIQELCIGRMLVPRRGSPGLAFLRPDKELLKKISDMANSDDPEPAIDALQSCVILDHMPTIRDFDDKKNDIPTYRRKKLPVSGVDGKKVTLKNGAEIVPDAKFQARKDRQNISVYILSKGLVPTDTDDADFSNAKPKNNRAVKGGAELAKTRKGLFDQVLKDHFDENIMENRNPAMEMLLGLCTFLDMNDKKEELNAVKSQLSWDTLASLAIVLRPYANNNQDLYVSDDSITKMSNNMTTNFVFYSLSSNPVRDYQKLMDECDENKIAGTIKDIQNNGVMTVNRFTTNKTIASIIEQVKSSFNNSPRRLLSYDNNGLIAIAEAELRAASALLHDCEKENNFVLKDSPLAQRVYCEKFTLDEPYADCIHPKKSNASKPSISEYYSQGNLIVRSDAIAYVPALLADADPISKSLTTEQNFIRLDADLKNYISNKSDSYAKSMSDKLELWQAILAKIKPSP